VIRLLPSSGGGEVDVSFLFFCREGKKDEAIEGLSAAVLFHDPLMGKEGGGEGVKCAAFSTSGRKKRLKKSVAS